MAEAAYLGSFLCVSVASFAASYVALGRRPGSPRSSVAWAELWARAEGFAPVREARAAARREALRASALRELPTMLDVVTLGLSSGLSFDASLGIYCARYETELSSALEECMLSWQIGAHSREEALRELARSLDVVALRRFADAVTQALAFGSPLSEVLEQQAQAIRDEQRAELEAEIERVPVKMLIPLGTLIVPAMLLAILGPILGSSLALV